jgi:hypothetical protein
VLKNCSFADLIVRLRPIVFLLNFFQIEIEKKNQFTKENPRVNAIRNSNKKENNVDIKAVFLF